jgi:uncharacterized membrane protein YwaF
MSVTVVKNFSIFFLGIKHAHKQVWLGLLTSFANLQMQSLGLHKNNEKCCSLPFALCAFKLQLTLVALLQNAKRLGFWHSTTSLVALLYSSLCYSGNTHTQRTSILLKCIQASFDYWEWEEHELLSEWSFWAQKIVLTGKN